MKKNLTLLALLCSLGSISYAQQTSVDLAPLAIMNPNQILSPGRPISPTGYVNPPAPADSIPGIVLFTIDTASGDLTTADTFLFIVPRSVLNTDGTVALFRGSITEDVIGRPDSYSPIFYLGGDWLCNVDTIQTLFNFNAFAEGKRLFKDILVRRSEFVDGQTYGWYAHMRPYPDWVAGSFTDPDTSNNWSYTPIIWKNNTNSIEELIKGTKYTPLEVYPNPTADKLNFVLEFSKNNKGTVARVTDINGRNVKMISLGSSISGKQQFSLDVADLRTGNYSLQVITDNAIYVQKFVRK
ncbi:T9SS type A sorting domain-containing protein [Taibaiella koreensis]|uniref:T9SS type A sorting domain-containing protein n=1 Tax=Taibaiella koreensis TaxID=1268548 RepID=UPI000E59A2DC|nr:T9SS type A sorting domain-containing protein [Taibaiella koreensis]